MQPNKSLMFAAAIILIGTSWFLYQLVTEDITDDLLLSVGYPAGHLLSACQFPLLDPWDKTILKYIAHPTDFTCTQVQTFDLMFLDDSGRLHLNQSAIATASLQLGNITCYYATIDRKQGPDDDAIARSKNFVVSSNESIVMATDVSEVTCFNKNETTVYYDLLVHPSNISNVTLPTTEDNLSVLWFVVDSTSLSMFRRNLPRTYQYLTEHMHAQVLRGFGKVGDNTFPNMLPAMTGQRVHRSTNSGGEIVVKIESGDKIGKIQYDSFDLIWKKFAKNGYVTSHNEDQPDIGLFHFRSKGFAAKPVHHYYRPFWLQLEAADLTKKSSRFCFGNKPKVQYQLDIIRKHWKKYNGKRQFMLSFFTELSHSYTNEIERADKSFVKLFSELTTQGYLNHTVAIVMGDHGHRFSDIRKTLVGLIEERTPAFMLAFPAWFLRKNQNIKSNLKENEWQLTAHFDVHETLLDILNANYNGTQRPRSQRGLSQLYPLPKDRTCEQAGIPEYFCVCQKEESISTSDALVASAALAIVDHINELLKNHTSLCATLEYNQTLRAEVRGINKLVSAGITNADNVKKNDKAPFSSELKAIRVSLQAIPSGAQFEGLVQFNNATGLLTVVRGSISRINAYGSQSNCINDPELRKYCYCT